MAVVTTQQKVAALYTAIFNRAPDQAGLNFWTAQIDAGKSFASVAAGFAQHEVFTTGIGALDNAGYVSALYTNILGSAGDTAGIAYWTARLAAGESKAAIVAEFVNGSLTIDIPALLASGGISAADAAAATIRQQTLTNKADVGIYFANTLGAASNLNPATVSTSKAGLEADPIYKASQAAIAGVDSTAASVQTAKDAIAVAAGSANPAEALLGHTFTLTTGADTFVGGASTDVFNALTVKADGGPATTLSAFDSIDGGAGNDTLNIYSDGTDNVGLNGATVKNVETINILNSGVGTGFGDVDASKFVGATTINQVNIANAVTGLAAGTTASFKNIAAVQNFSVSVADAAATAVVALSNVTEGSTVIVNAGAAGVLNNVTVSGVQADSNNNGIVVKNNVAVAVGKDVETLTLNTASGTTLFVSEQALVTKHVTTVDASASTGDVSYDGLVGAAGKTVSTIKTGVGKDTVTLQTALTATAKAASVSTGEGDDTLNILATAAASSAATVAVDAGAGNDKINLTINSDITYNVAGGAGDDTVVITNTVKTTDKIDGGAGTDTVSLALGAPKTLVADDYIVFNKVLTNFETLQLTGSAATMDASLLGAGYTTVDLATGSKVINVGAQALVAHGNLTAEANGVVFNTAGDNTSGVKTYAGSLNVTETANGAVTAFANSIALSVKAGTVGVASTLVGDVQAATVSLVNSVNNATAPTADTIASVTVGTGTGVVDAANNIVGLTSLTLSGNGSATVFNGASDKLVTVDASNLGGVYTLGVNKGAAIAGLTYTSGNTSAETIKLGAGQDNITLGASTYGKVDVVSGLNLVAKAGDAKAVDATKSDILHIAGVDLSSAAAKNFTTTQTDLDLALKDAATYSKANSNTDVAFHMGGNTYVFHDSVAGNGLIDATDTVVQIAGQVNLDLLASSLAVA